MSLGSFRGRKLGHFAAQGPRRTTGREQKKAQTWAVRADQRPPATLLFTHGLPVALAPCLAGGWLRLPDRQMVRRGSIKAHGWLVMEKSSLEGAAVVQEELEELEEAWRALRLLEESLLR